MSVPADRVIEHIVTEVDHFDGRTTPVDKKVSVSIDSITNREGHSNLFAAGSEVDIRWTAKSNVGDVWSVILYYVTEDGDRHIIGFLDAGLGEYRWKIPAFVSRIEQPNIEFIEDDDIRMTRKPSVSVVPGRDGVVGTDCFVINDPGEFESGGYIQMSCETVDSSGNFVVHDGYVGEIDMDGHLERVYLYSDIREQVELQVMTEEPFSYEIGTAARKITVGIAYPSNDEIFDEKPNILII